jgi:hypothetical protein
MSSTRLRRALIVIVSTAVLLAACKQMMDFVAYRVLLDYDPYVDSIRMKFPPNAVILVGNGPLTADQRTIIRSATPDQIFRFNGMPNLHPKEAVGHLFARRCDNSTIPWSYWGLSPPISFVGVLEKLFVPFSDIGSRYMCNRVHEAVGVILLHGRAEDVPGAPHVNLSNTELPDSSPTPHPPPHTHTTLAQS